MEQKGFFGRLFDLSFTQFVTPGIIKILFIIGVVLSVVAAVGMLIGFEQRGSLVVGLILAPIVLLLYVIAARVWCELIIVMFRICDNTTQIAGGNKAPEAGGTE